MRCLAAVAFLAGAGAFVAPPGPGPLRRSGQTVAGALPPSTAGVDEGAHAARGAAGGGSRLGSTVGAVVAFGALLRAASRRRGRGSRRPAATRRAEAEGELDPNWSYENGEPLPVAQGPGRGFDLEAQESGADNWVNPWNQMTDADQAAVKGPTPSGWKFHEYGGPVYKKVPVAQGLSFPLDPNLYYPPLEPPPPGGKWGDGRDADGNWYMDIDGEQTQYWQGWGRRKTACAIVRLVKGDGQFIINGRDAVEYFQYYPIWWLKAAEPMAALSIKNDYDCICKAFGGGKSGQAGAIRLGMARAMQEIDFNWRPLMKKAKYLTRDFRMVEPKKHGRHKARKKKPYHKR